MADPLGSPPITSLDLTPESKGSENQTEIASRDIDLVPLIHLLATDSFLPLLVLNGTLG